MFWSCFVVSFYLYKVADSASKFEVLRSLSEAEMWPSQDCRTKPPRAVLAVLRGI